MDSSGSRSRALVWIALAVGTALLALFFVFVLRSGSCYDAAAGGRGESYCESGSAVGVGGATVIAVCGTLVIALAVWRAAAAWRATANRRDP